MAKSNGVAVRAIEKRSMERAEVANFSTEKDVTRIKAVFAP